MTKREISSLVIKLIGVFLLIELAPSLVNSLSIFTSIKGTYDLKMQLMSFGIFLIPATIWIGFCISIILLSNKIAKMIIREDEECSQIFSLSFEDTQILGYNFIGLLVIVKAFPQVVNLLYRIVYESRFLPMSERSNFFRNSMPSFLALITQLIIGFVLFFRTNGLVNLWKMFQDKTRPMKKIAR